MNIKDKNIAVIGSARSGVAAAKLAHHLGANVTLFDSKKQDQFKEEQLQQFKALTTQGISVHLATMPELAGYDYVIKSPGVPMDLPFLQKFKACGGQVFGEFEFASRYCKAPILAITGTNGKTTTTALVGEIAKASHSNTYVVGNIGNAFSEDVLKIKEEDIVVAEISSFQLEAIETFHPRVSAILNITPDHLDRHKTMEAYTKAKSDISKKQTQDDYIILNGADPICMAQQMVASSKSILFDINKKVVCGAYLEEGVLYENIDGRTHAICKVDELKILGVHNVENTLAAIAITRAFGIDWKIVRETVINYTGVAHRNEYLCIKKGIEFYNDSKATNTDAAIKGLLAIPKPVRLIAGGKDKKGSFKEWIACFEGRVKKVYVIGETTNQIIKECSEQGYTQIEAFDTLDEATKKAYHEACFGEVILLSPACASWDMYESFEQRGDHFKTIVEDLKG